MRDKNPRMGSTIYELIVGINIHHKDMGFWAAAG